MTMEISMLAMPFEILASSSSDSGSGRLFFGALFLLSGFIYYAVIYARYRNAGKRHGYESETKADLHDVRASDEFYRSIKGVSNSTMEGANHTEVRGARRGIS